MARSGGRVKDNLEKGQKKWKRVHISLSFFLYIKRKEISDVLNKPLEINWQHD